MFGDVRGLNGLPFHKPSLLTRIVPLTDFVYAIISRFKIINEISTDKLYRVCKISYENFTSDIVQKKEKINFSDLELIFKDLKNIFEKKGFVINWSELKNQDLNQTINTLSMASPFSLEEKQTLLESFDIKSRKVKLEEILKTYIMDEYRNTTLQ